MLSNPEVNTAVNSSEKQLLGDIYNESVKILDKNSPQLRFTIGYPFGEEGYARPPYPPYISISHDKESQELEIECVDDQKFSPTVGQWVKLFLAGNKIKDFSLSITHNTLHGDFLSLFGGETENTKYTETLRELGIKIPENTPFDDKNEIVKILKDIKVVLGQTETALAKQEDTQRRKLN